MGIMIVRGLMLLVGVAAGLSWGSAIGAGVPRPWSGAVGLAVGLLAVLLERQARRVPADKLLWAVAGGSLGALIGLGCAAAVSALAPAVAAPARALFALLLAYVGAVVMLAKRQELGDLAVVASSAMSGRESQKILDTSVIIDGRIVDVCDTGCLEGTLLLPQFVLRELQQIADSPDGIKRNRGKRGFDVLSRLKRVPKVTVQIDSRDFPQLRDVDGKLIELAKAIGGKLVTNDATLSKVAALSGVAVLNINEVANALRPVILTGEPMQVYIVKEGKEAGQGVAYLDDGTMIVVDHGKRLIGQTVEVTVTTMLQTAAGRMIFARLREEETAQR